MQTQSVGSVNSWLEEEIRVSSNEEFPNVLNVC